MDLKKLLDEIQSCFVDAQAYLKNFPCFKTIEIEVDQILMLKWDYDHKLIEFLNREESHPHWTSIFQSNVKTRIDCFYELDNLINEAKIATVQSLDFDKLSNSIKEVRQMIGESKNAI